MQAQNVGRLGEGSQCKPKQSAGLACSTVQIELQPRAISVAPHLEIVYQCSAGVAMAFHYMHKGLLGRSWKFCIL
jgi:hypothetical protein